jgi:hypothetical protein
MALGGIGHSASEAIPNVQALENDPTSDAMLRDLSKQTIRLIK